MSLKTINRNIVMKAGTSDTYEVRNIPRGYNFLSIVNPTNNTLSVLEGIVTYADASDINAVANIPLNSSLTISLDNRSEFTISWTDGGGGSDKVAQLFFSVENLQINGALGSATSADVNISSDSVGLAKQAQLPAALTAGGNLGVAVEESLPAGANVIGHVIVDSIPTVTTTDNSKMTTTPSTTQLTLTASTATPCRVGGSDLATRKQLALYNMDATNTIYIGGSGVTDTTGFPIPAGGTIIFEQNPDYSAPVYAYTTGTGVKLAVMEVA